MPQCEATQNYQLFVHCFFTYTANKAQTSLQVCSTWHLVKSRVPVLKAGVPQTNLAWNVEWVVYPIDPDVPAFRDHMCHVETQDARLALWRGKP